MGSFNTTCAISHAPIREGDKVRLFFLASTATYKGSISMGCQCYPCDDFQVIGGIGIEATYADYNNYEFDENSIIAKFILNTIHEKYSKNIPEEGVDYNPYHDHMNVDVDELDWEKVLDMIHSGRLFLKSFTGNDQFVATMAVHETVFQAFTKKEIRFYDYDKRESVTQTVDIAVEVEYNKIINVDEKKLKLLEHYKNDVFKTAYDEIGNDTDKIARLDSTIMGIVTRELDSFESMRGGMLDFVYLSINPTSSIISFAKQEDIILSADEIKNIIRTAKETEFFNYSMVLYNFMYRPIITSGQEHDLPEHASMLLRLADAIDDIKFDWEVDEYLPTNMHKEHWQAINKSVIELKYKEWYGEDADEYISALNNHFLDNTVLIIKPNEMDYHNDKYNLYGLVKNNTVELRIYNK